VKAPGERRITLLTGERGAGKSTVCLALARLARAAGVAVSGVASRSVIRDGGRAGLEAVDLATLDSWRLASTLQTLGGPAIGPFSFDPAGLARALALVEAAADSAATLLAIDEIGPLELTFHEGFYPVLGPLAQRPSPDLLFVVRPSLLDTLAGLFARDRPRVVETTAANRDELPAALLRELARGTP
jgi:nucleoside-triphosphatase